MYVIKTMITIAIIFTFSVSGCKIISRKYDTELNNYLINKQALNDYIEKNNGIIVFKDLKLEHYNLDGIIVKELIIDNSSLDNITANDSTIDLLIIKNSDLSNTDFKFTTIGELNIENSNLNKVVIGSNDTVKTIISKSNIEYSRFAIESDSIQILNSYLDDVWFIRSSAVKMEIINSIFNNSEKSSFASMKIDSLLIKDSSLNVTFRGSEIKDVVLENVSGRYVDFLGVKGNKVTISDSDVGAFILGGTQNMNSFESVNSKIRSFSMNGLKIKKISIKNCFRKTDISFMKSAIEEVDIDNCDFRKSMFAKAKIEKMSIKNSEITSDHWIVGGWEKMRIEELTLENVLIDGIFRMQNAYIGILKTKNFRKGRNLDINYEGANFKF